MAKVETSSYFTDFKTYIFLHFNISVITLLPTTDLKLHCVIVQLQYFFPSMIYKTIVASYNQGHPIFDEILLFQSSFQEVK